MGLLNKLKTNQKGIAHLGLLLVIVSALSAIGFVGYNVYKKSTSDAASGFYSSKKFCDSLHRVHSGNSRWGVCKRTCKSGYGPKLTWAPKYDYCKKAKSSKAEAAQKKNKAAAAKASTCVPSKKTFSTQCPKGKRYDVGKKRSTIKIVSGTWKICADRANSQDKCTTVRSGSHTTCKKYNSRYTFCNEPATRKIFLKRQ